LYFPILFVFCIDIPTGIPIGQEREEERKRPVRVPTPPPWQSGIGMMVNGNFLEVG